MHSLQALSHHHSYCMRQPFKVNNFRGNCVRRVHATADQSFSPSKEYRHLCIETAKAVSERLLKPIPQPETFDLMELMQDIGNGLGYRVESSNGRISVRTRAGMGHQRAEKRLVKRIDDEPGWEILPGIHLKLKEGIYRIPDISGWRTSVNIANSASNVTIRPDWICEILSPSNKKDDLPGGIKFNEYQDCGIPYYWIVDPVKGQIVVYEWCVDEYLQIKKVTVGIDTFCVLEPFRLELDLEEIFAYLK